MFHFFFLYVRYVYAFWIMGRVNYRRTVLNKPGSEKHISTHALHVFFPTIEFLFGRPFRKKSLPFMT